MVPVRGVCMCVWPLSSAPVGVSFLSDFPVLQVWVLRGSCAKVGEALVCVRVPRPPTRPRRRRCVGDTPASLVGVRRPERAWTREMSALAAPLCRCRFFPARAWTPRLCGCPLRLGVTAPLLGCSPPPHPPRARGRAACSRDRPPCSSARAGVRPLVSPRAWVLVSAWSPGCEFSFESVGERCCTPPSPVFCVLYKCATCFRENGCRVRGGGRGRET